jgi:hypothetical protein
LLGQEHLGIEKVAHELHLMIKETIKEQQVVSTAPP